MVRAGAIREFMARSIFFKTSKQNCGCAFRLDMHDVTMSAVVVGPR